MNAGEHTPRTDPERLKELITQYFARTSAETSALRFAHLLEAQGESESEPTLAETAAEISWQFRETSRPLSHDAVGALAAWGILLLEKLAAVKTFLSDATAAPPDPFLLSPVRQRFLASRRHFLTPPASGLLPTKPQAQVLRSHLERLSSGEDELSADTRRACRDFFSTVSLYLDELGV